jgi:hypothetical protein
MSVNYNDGRIISLYDFVNNLDSNYTALNERIFIIVYFFSLKYCQQRLTFNENSLNFVEDSSFPWGFRLKVPEQNMKHMNDYFRVNKFDFNPAFFKFIYSRIVSLNYPLLNNFKYIIYHFFTYHESDQEFMVKKTRELFKTENFENFKMVFNKIFD